MPKLLKNLTQHIIKNMINKNEIVEYYNSLCLDEGDCLTREKYRNMNPKYKSSLIEKIWGSWTNFIKESKSATHESRNTLIKTFNKNINKVVISYVSDGSTLHVDFYKTLLNYCKENNTKLGILWGKATSKNKTFDKDTFEKLRPYLATKFILEKDKSCIIQDFLIPSTQKNPLLNLDKLSTDLKTIIVGSTKQYLQVLPYKQYNPYRIACSTGTLSEINYKETVAGQLDLKNHKYGAILLEWNEEQERYVIRNLIYKNGCICDLNKKYTTDKVTKIDTLPAMILGDLHLPDEDINALNKTKEFINKYKPEYTMLHDIASWNSICHHNFGKALFNAQNISFENACLGNEMKAVVDKIINLSKDCPNTEFKIVNSNHDAFVEKWLDTGEFVKDKTNARLGAELFIDYCDGKRILDPHLPKNFKYLPKNEEFKICGFIVSEHGDAGISGANGSPNTFNKTFENCIVGHTHSCEIREKTFYVGTLSKLIVNYNQKGMTKWVHANAIIHENETAQLILL